MNRKLLWLLTVIFLAAGNLADAQQPAKVHRVGTLEGSSPQASAPYGRHFDEAYGSLAMWKEKTSSWNRDGLRESATG
jgi:hypothetical protein